MVEIYDTAVTTKYLSEIVFIKLDIGVNSVCKLDVKKVKKNKVHIKEMKHV